MSLVNVALISLLGMPYAVLMPVFASTVLHGGAHALGILMTSVGIGALCGTAYLACRHSVVGLGKVIVSATLMLSAGLVVFALSHSLWLSVAVLPFVGAGMMLESSSSNTILQTVVSEDLRGRVMAFYSVAVLGTQPIGSLIGGIVADRIGAPRTILIGAIGCALAGTWFAYRRPMLAQEASANLREAVELFIESADAAEVARRLTSIRFMCHPERSEGPGWQGGTSRAPSAHPGSSLRSE